MEKKDIVQGDFIRHYDIRHKTLMTHMFIQYNMYLILFHFTLLLFYFLPAARMRTIIMDMFFVGMDTASTALTWLFKFMIANPDIQKKCLQEIDSVNKTLRKNLMGN